MKTGNLFHSAGPANSLSANVKKLKFWVDSWQVHLKCSEWCCSCKKTRCQFFYWVPRSGGAQTPNSLCEICKLLYLLMGVSDPNICGMVGFRIGRYKLH